MNIPLIVLCFTIPASISFILYRFFILIERVIGSYVSLKTNLDNTHFRSRLTAVENIIMSSMSNGQNK